MLVLSHDCFMSLSCAKSCILQFACKIADNELPAALDFRVFEGV